MKAALYTQGQGFRIGRIPYPEPRAGDMLLKVRATAICGTDTKILSNGHGKLQDGQQIVLGHELVGEIVALPAQATGLRAGQRVGIVPNVGCGRCRACRRGQANYCADYAALGITLHGAHTEYIQVPATFIQQGNVFVIPDTVGDTDAVLLEPFSCVINGIRSTTVNLGDIAVIYGAGPIGLMHLLLLRISGAAKIIVIDLVDARLERASRLGADCTINATRENVQTRVMEATGGQGADLVITACAVAAVQEEAVRLLATFGRLCLFGSLPKGKGIINFDSNAVHYRNNLITGTTGGSPEDYEIGLKLVENHRIALDQVISDIFPLSKLEDAYEKAQSAPLGKVVMRAEGAH